METILTAILTLAPPLFNLLERLFGKGQGDKKKDVAKSSFAAFAKGMQIVTTGGARDTWSTINKNMEGIGNLIDGGVHAMQSVGFLNGEEHDYMGN